MQSFGAFLADDLEVGFPHVGADEHDLGSDFFADGGEESLKGLDRSLLADPKQTGNLPTSTSVIRQLLEAGLEPRLGESGHG